MRSSQRFISIILVLLVGLSLLGNPAINQTMAATDFSALNLFYVSPKLLSTNQNMNSTIASTTNLLGSTSTSSKQGSDTSPITTTASSTKSISTSPTTQTTATSSQTTSSAVSISSTSTMAVTTGSTQTTTSSSTTSTTSLTSSTQTTPEISANSTDPITVPSISLNPNSGSAGSTVQVSGSGFSTSDTACSISGKVVVSQTCSVSNGALTATAFTVANVAGGSYSVKVTGTPTEDSASAQFTVNAPAPSIKLTPSSAQAGATVQVSGSGFLASDNACTLSGNPVTASTCSISNGILSATFNVATVATGAYTIRAIGKPGSDFASAQFTVSSTTTSSYSISFGPPYWLCTDVQVTFTGPLIESGFFGDTLQFQYSQYNPSYPSTLNPIFTDPGLTVTSDTVSYWIHYPEYGPVNFEYMPNIAVRVVDVTPKPNDYAPGLIFMQLTNVTPESYQSCPIAPIDNPEFQVQWLMIIISLAVGLGFLRVHSVRERRNHRHKGNGLLKAESKKYVKRHEAKHHSCPPSPLPFHQYASR